MDLTSPAETNIVRLSYLHPKQNTGFALWSPKNDMLQSYLKHKARVSTPSKRRDEEEEEELEEERGGRCSHRAQGGDRVHGASRERKAEAQHRKVAAAPEELQRPRVQGVALHTHPQRLLSVEARASGVRAVRSDQPRQTGKSFVP